MLKRFRLIAFAAVVSTVAYLQPAHATAPSDLCTGNPCVIAADATLDPADDLDFGAATQVRVAAGVRLTVGDGPASSTVGISAGSIILEPGSTILAREGTLTLDAVAGNLELQSSDSAFASIRFRRFVDLPPAGPRAELSLLAQGDVVLDGAVMGKQRGAFSMVDLVDIIAAGDIRGTGRIDVRNPRLNESSDRPTVQLYAAGGVGFAGRILARGGCIGGTVYVTSEIGPTEVAAIDASAGGCLAWDGSALGGEVRITSAGEARLTGTLRARTRDVGGDVTVSADAFVLEGQIDARGKRGSGGTLRVDGGDFVMQSTAKIRLASQSGDGRMEVIASDALSTGDVVLTWLRDVGELHVNARGGIAVESAIMSRAIAPIAIALEGCGAVSVAAGARIESRGEGDIVLSGDSVSVAGAIVASGPTSVVHLNYVSVPVAVTGTVVPVPIVTQIPGCT